MITMNEKLYREAMEGSKPVLIEYWAPWCVYCRRIAPAMKQLSERREDLLVAQVNIDDHPELAKLEQIEVIPTLVLYEGGEALGSIVAPESRSRIEEFLADYLDN
jgi:thioredoxin-like negative regulator of GroEL